MNAFFAIYLSVPSIALFTSAKKTILFPASKKQTSLIAKSPLHSSLALLEDSSLIDGDSQSMRNGFSEPYNNNIICGPKGGLWRHLRVSSYPYVHVVQIYFIMVLVSCLHEHPFKSYKQKREQYL